MGIDHREHKGHRERLRELARVSGRLVEFGARWKALLRASGDSPKAKKIIRAMRLRETRPHLLQPDVWTKGRGTTAAEMLRAIPEDVRVDRPYPQWADEIDKIPSMNKIVSGVQGLGSSALALKAKTGDTLKIQTLPFSRSRFDISTNKIGTVKVPKHHKAPKGILHVGTQPTAVVMPDSVFTPGGGYVPAMLYRHKMKRAGYSPGEFKSENFGIVKGQMKYIDADGSFRLQR